MGILLSRFRSKLSTKDILEDIDKKLRSIDEFQQDTIERQKRIARRTIVTAVCVYIIAIAAFFVITSIQKFKLYYFTGLAVFAVVAWIFHKSLRLYFTSQMTRNSEKSVELRKKKKKILEEVMDKETYKVAKEILDKFGDKAQPTPLEARSIISPVNRVSSTPGTELHQRQVESKPSQVRTNAPITAPPLPPTTPAANTHMKIPQQMTVAQRPIAMNYGHAPLRPLPRPILPRERGLVDRMMDFFVGDGPNQRYALVCRHCGGHNGMALQEEFEYVSYYCCYCYQFNPPRKMRPMGPRLPLPPPPAPATPSQIPKVSEEKRDFDESSTKSDDKRVKTESNSENETSESEESSSNQVKEADDDDDASEKMDVDAQEDEEGKTLLDDTEPSSLR